MGDKPAEGAVARTVAESRSPDENLETRVQAVVKKFADGGGYGIVYGVAAKEEWLDALVRNSNLHLIAVERDQGVVQRLRRKYLNQGLYGNRVVIVRSEPREYRLPPYVAQLIAIGESRATQDKLWLRRVYQTLRPFGGVAWCAGDSSPLAELARDTKLSGAKITRSGGDTFVQRTGPLPGSADWTHEYGDIGNTLMSQDGLVKAPLGVLWFGGPAAASDLFFNRHYWAPSLVVSQGRMFMQGPKLMSCVDIYTGRVLWKKTLAKGASPGRRGNFFEKVRAGNHFIAANDAVYLSDGKRCELLDPATGDTLRSFAPPQAGMSWGRIRIAGDLLITTFFSLDEFKKLRPSHLVVMDRHTGKVTWQQKVRYGVPFVAIGKDKLFYYDAVVEGLYDDWKRRGLIPPAGDFRYLKAVDLKTGKPLWEKTTGNIVTWLGYSHQHDVLISSNKKGMQAWQGKSGDEMWKKQQEGCRLQGAP